MWQFLGNNLDTVLVVAGVVGGWLGLTNKQRSTAALVAHVRRALVAAAAPLLADPNAYAKARRVLTDAAHAALARFGVPRSKTTDRLLEVAITEAEAQLAERLLTQTFDALARRADGVVATLEGSR